MLVAFISLISVKESKTILTLSLEDSQSDDLVYKLFAIRLFISTDSSSLGGDGKFFPSFIF